ncbi:hypothetical protein [Nitrosomonas ureae]|uniref:hypothetical protein n=1 Tax=Nitrosomonas ureae TaxID=44577 RepID=UPI000D769BF9|nr:hypothetical protein [Nitrosomonas ureae]
MTRRSPKHLQNPLEVTGRHTIFVFPAPDMRGAKMPLQVMLQNSNGKVVHQLTKEITGEIT